MNKDRKYTILIILIVTLSLVGIGIAFAAFSQTLTINGSAEVEASKWQVVFEGVTSASTIDAPTTSGTASEITRPTIKSNDTEISTYSVSLKTPGDSITYNFKIHNKGDYAANLSSLTISGVNRPSSPVSGASLVTDSSIATANASTLAVIEYKFYYTDNNQLVGQDSKDCLEPGESENVSLKITFASSDATDTSILPSSNLVLDNLGVSAVYNQSNNGSCGLEPGERVVDASFSNQDGLYYTYEGKRFVGTGVNNVLLSENIVSRAKYSTSFGIDNGEGTNPRYTFADHPALNAAVAYCTNCRFMTYAEAKSWGCKDYPTDSPAKCRGYYNGNAVEWWLADIFNEFRVYLMNDHGHLYGGDNYNYSVKAELGIRPAVSIPSTATITGSGTSTEPYVITTN